MKTLFVLIAMLLALQVFAQKDIPPKWSYIDKGHNKAVFGDDSNSVTLWQFTLRNDTLASVDSAKFYEIINADTVLLRFKNCKTGVEDTIVNKTGVAQDYLLVKPIIGRVVVKLLSPTSIEVYLRRRKQF